MIKKSVKWIAGIFGVVIAALIIAGIAVFVIVDKEFVENQMENALHRQVSIENINIGIFSIISGIKVNDVRVSNYKTPEQLQKLVGQPVAPDDIFVSLEAFVFEVKLLPLLQKAFVLQQLTLKKPHIHVIRYADGSMNFDDLLKPGAAPEKEKIPPEKEEKKKEEEITADTLPIAISMGTVGIEEGVVSLYDRKFKQKFEFYDLTAIVHDIEIDPNHLDKKDQVKIKVDMGAKTIGQMKTGSVKSFDIQLALNGTVKPFDLKTRKLNPELSAKVGSPHGMVTGLQIFKALKTIEQLEKYTGKLSFLKETQEWRDAETELRYKDGIVKFQDGAISTDDYRMKLGGSLNLNAKTVNSDIEMVLNKNHSNTMREGIIKNLNSVISKDVAQYVKKEDIADIAMKPLVNEDGKVYLKYKVTGSAQNPSATLIHPALAKLNDIVKQSAGDIAGKIKERTRQAAAKEVDKQKKAATERANKEAGKQLENLKENLPF